MTIEDIMPEEHFLRDLGKYVDFSFIYDKVEHLYSKTGRPSIDPVVLIKMILIGFLYGIESERRIEKEINVNIAYKWFLGLALDEKSPDHCTISQTRKRKFDGIEIFREIFNEIIKRCIEAGLVKGENLLVDSTHVKANVAIYKNEVIEVNVEPSKYLKRLDETAMKEGLITDTQKRHAEKKVPQTKKITKSKIDPDCGMLSRPMKPKGFYYLSHETTDAESGIVTDVFVTPANTSDITPCVGRIKHQLNTFGFDTKAIGADKGYDFTELHHEMFELGIKTYIPKRKEEKYDIYSVYDFKYVEENDVFICPNGCLLKFSYYHREKGTKRYKTKVKDCKNCPSMSKCINEKSKVKEIEIPYFNEIAKIQRQNNFTDKFKYIQRLRKIRCEGNFSIQKECHNLRRTYKRGNERVTAHCLFSALALNLRRLVRHLNGRQITEFVTA
jgi:transposase